MRFIGIDSAVVSFFTVILLRHHLLFAGCWYVKNITPVDRFYFSSCMIASNTPDSQNIGDDAYFIFFLFFLTSRALPVGGRKYIYGCKILFSSVFYLAVRNWKQKWQIYLSWRLITIVNWKAILFEFANISFDRHNFGGKNEKYNSIMVG